MSESHTTRPNQAAPGNGAMALLVQIQRLRRAVPEQYRSATLHVMKLDRVGSAALFLQGVMPALVFGFWRPGGLFLFVVAVIYAALAWGVWSSKRWALISAIIFTVPQLFIISSKVFSWQFFIGGAFGAGVAPSPSLLDTRISSFFSLGARFDFAVSERCPSLLASFTYIRSETFVLLNAIAFLVFAILLTILRRRSKVEIRPERGGAANGSQPIRSETDSTSSAAGSRR